MLNFRNIMLSAVCALALAFLGFSDLASAATKAEINKDATTALNTLYKAHPNTKKIGERAKGILIFPHILKAGLIIGGAFGEGVLRVKGKADGYYTSTAASYGLQIGAMRFG
jgi:lipid-binding SYLF domain-containing protein